MRAKRDPQCCFSEPTAGVKTLLSFGRDSLRTLFRMPVCAFLLPTAVIYRVFYRELIIAVFK